jgi:hypothetical protein
MKSVQDQVNDKNGFVKNILLNFLLIGLLIFKGFLSSSCCFLNFEKKTFYLAAA